MEMGSSEVQFAERGPGSERLTTRAAAHVSIGIYTEHTFWAGLTMNISEGGIFVATYRPFPLGARLKVHVALPGEHEPFVALAEVRWVREHTNNADAPAGVGLKFIDLSEESHAKVRRFVATVRAPLFFED
jgi:uncharacterized protein (TIGR02266 family)